MASEVQFIGRRRCLRRDADVLDVPQSERFRPKLASRQSLVEAPFIQSRKAVCPGKLILIRGPGRTQDGIGVRNRTNQGSMDGQSGPITIWRKDIPIPVLNSTLFTSNYHSWFRVCFRSRGYLVAVRPKRTKRPLQEAFGNVSEKLNELVERELSHSPPPDWRGVLKRPAPAADPKAYDLCLRPE